MDTLQEILGTIRRNWMRTLATGFAVVSGLFLLIVLQGAGNGIIHTFEYNMGNFAFDAIHIFGGRTTMPFEGTKEGRFIQLNKKDVEMSQKSFSNHVTCVLPQVSKEGLTANHGDEYVASVTLRGVLPDFAPSNAVKILEGRFINEIDIQQERKVVVVGSENIQDLFPEKKHQSKSSILFRDVLGEHLNVSGISYQIVGVYKTDEMSNSNEFYTPFTTVSTIYNRGDFIDEMTMNIHDIPTEEAMEEFMDDYITASSHLHNFNPKDKRALWIWNQAGDNIQMEKASRILHTSFWILGLLTLLSGVVSVSNIMLISVRERTHEFGIRRAIGARPWNIIRMVMMESILITGIFGYIGMLLGVLFCEYMDATVGGQTADLGVFQTKYFLDPTVGIDTCLQATLVIVVAGALAGIFPALKAMRMKTIDALRS